MCCLLVSDAHADMSCCWVPLVCAGLGWLPVMDVSAGCLLVLDVCADVV
jgi:hypothetical protein